MFWNGNSPQLPSFLPPKALCQSRLTLGCPYFMLSVGKLFCPFPSSGTTQRVSKRAMSSPKDDTKSTRKLRPIIFAGPSAVGKGTLIDMLRAEFPTKVGYSVSHTTRAPRQGEVDGLHYHFTTLEKFQELMKEGKFVETAKVHTNMYGTSFAAVEAVAKTGKLCLMDLDIQGCQTVKSSTLDACFVFIEPPSMDELLKRLRARAKEDEAAMKVRMETAKHEMTFRDDGLWDSVVMNDNLDQAYIKIKDFINANEDNFLKH